MNSRNGNVFVVIRIKITLIRLFLLCCLGNDSFLTSVNAVHSVKLSNFKSLVMIRPYAPLIHILLPNAFKHALHKTRII